MAGKIELAGDLKMLISVVSWLESGFENYATLCNIIELTQLHILITNTVSEIPTQTPEIKRFRCVVT